MCFLSAHSDLWHANIGVVCVWIVDGQRSSAAWFVVKLELCVRQAIFSLVVIWLQIQQKQSMKSSKSKLKEKMFSQLPFETRKFTFLSSTLLWPWKRSRSSNHHVCEKLVKGIWHAKHQGSNMVTERKEKINHWGFGRRPISCTTKKTHSLFPSNACKFMKNACKFMILLKHVTNSEHQTTPYPENETFSLTWPTPLWN